MMFHPSRKSLPPALPAAVLSLLVLGGGLFFGRGRAWGAEFDAIATDLGWFAVGAAVVLVVMRAIRQTGRGMTAARDDDAYYRRSHFGSE